MTSKLIRMALYASAVLFAGCSSSKDKGLENDPKDGERIYECSIRESNDEFDKTVQTSSDGYALINIEHKRFAYTDFYQLYTPNGNLCLIASGAQEACALSGWRVDYDSEGRVSKVCQLGTLDDEAYHHSTTTDHGVEIFKEWLCSSLRNDSCPTFEILRDENNEVVKVGSIEVPYGFKARYYLSEWGNFWESDLNGGDISFFLELEDQDIEGSSVNYLYANGKLIAELAYWKGTFIKARTYNRHGVMVRQYADREMDVRERAFHDQSETPKWYVDPPQD